MHPAVVTCARTVVCLLTGVFVVAAATASGVASAHTDFDYSVPADGASVDEPVAEITVAFTLPVTLVGNGFEVLDPQTDVIQPAVASDDGRVFVLRFDPPLAGGAVGVRYEVTAEDGHVLSGAFSFTVDAAIVTTTAVPTIAEPEPAIESTIAQPPTDEPSTEPIEETATDDTVPPSTTTTTMVSVPDDDAVDGSTSENPASDSVGDAGGSNAGIYVALAGLVAAGGAGFLILRSRSTG